MKKILFTIMSFALLSCCNDEIIIQEPVIVTKQLTYDLEDNMIRIDGAWKHNSNNDENNWVYYEDFGWRWYEGNLYCYFNKDKYELIDAQLLNCDDYWYLETDLNNDYYFSSQYFSNWGTNFGMMFHVKIILKEK